MYMSTDDTHFRKHFFQNWKFTIVEHSFEILELCILGNWKFNFNEAIAESAGFRILGRSSQG